MIGQNFAKWGIVTSPAVIADNTALTTTVIDSLGFDRLEVILVLGALDIPMTVFKLQESNASGSGFADITGLVGGTDFTLPIATDDNKMGVLDVNLVNQVRMRYFDVAATVGDGAAGTYVAILYRLSKGHVDPVSAADAGLLFKMVI